MRANHNSDGGRGASVSRRNFLQIATAISAATLPAVAEAAVEEIPQLPLTDEQQLDACIGQLRNILQRMHPGYGDVTGGYFRHKNGGASVWIDLYRKPGGWDEPGLYLVDYGNVNRIEAEFYVTQEWSDLERRHLLWGVGVYDGKLVAPREIIESDRIIRKLKGGAI